MLCIDLGDELVTLMGHGDDEAMIAMERRLRQLRINRRGRDLAVSLAGYAAACLAAAHSSRSSD